MISMYLVLDHSFDQRSLALIELERGRNGQPIHNISYMQIQRNRVKCMEGILKERLGV